MKKSTCHVLVVIGQYPPSHSGAGLRVHRTYKRLQSAGPIQFRVLCYSDRTEDADPVYDGVEVRRVSLARRRDLVRLLREEFSRRKEHRPDIVHCIGDVALTDAVALLSVLYGVPLIREVSLFRNWLDQTRLIYQLKESTDPRQAVLRYFRYRFKRLTYRRAGLLVAMNTGITSFYQSIGVKTRRILERPNPVDLSVFCLPEEGRRASVRQQFGFSKTDRVHLLVGRFDVRKNHIFALEALALLPSNHRLVLVGPTLDEDGDYLNEVKCRMDDLKLSSRVLLVPEMRQDIALFYQAADSLWMVSLNEGTPNVLLEGMVCGLPAFVNKQLGLQEFVGSDDGSCVGLQPDVFAHEVESVLAEETKTKRQLRHRNAAQQFGAPQLDQIFMEKLQNMKKERSF